MFFSRSAIAFKTDEGAAEPSSSAETRFWSFRFS